MLFDLDGVLVDSRPAVERLWQAFAREHAVDPAFIAHVHGRRSVDTLAEFAPHLVHLAQALDEREALDLDGVAALPGALELLSALQPDRCAVVTSGTRGLATARLPAVGLPVPPVLITADDVAEGKPDPSGYLLAAERLGVEPNDCIVVEDAVAGIEAGRRARMTVVGVTASRPEAELPGAHAYVGSLRDLGGIAAGTLSRPLPPAGDSSG